IADYFDVVVGFEDTGKHKPRPEPFVNALQKLKCKPAEVLYVGDWPERDIAGAKKAGMKTCLAKYGKNTPGKKVKADFQIIKVSQLVKLA
ncbi:MAG: HAD-IA family hydrolase, partial [Candidatus Woesearchaeota archaeon]